MATITPAAAPIAQAASAKPRLSWLRIAEMNLGFLGLQFSFGLQQSNMGPIYSYLGADEGKMPLLWLAGPVTGLLVQPIVGALSDRTASRWGRRTPYFLVGAIFCSLFLFLMPNSSALWMAASLLWLLDAANNITMEPYRAYVGDRLDPAQQPTGYLMQGAFTGLAQTLSYLTPSILVWIGFSRSAVDENGIPQITHIAFMIGALLSITTIVWSLMRVPELPLTPAQIAEMRKEKVSAGLILRDIGQAVVNMPPTMRQLALSMFCQWYAMFCYWQYVVHSLARNIYGTADAQSQGFRDAALLNGQIGGFYNFIAFLGGFAMIPIARKFGANPVHAVCLGLSGAGMLWLAQITDPALLYLPMIGIGIAWASMMGNNYIMLVQSLPPEKFGIYMGIFNGFIVIPMIIQTLTMPLIYRPLLNADPRNVLIFAGALMIAGGLAVLTVKIIPHRANAKQ
jgi:maltose/moltooligosaccharide transporter